MSVQTITITVLTVHQVNDACHLPLRKLADSKFLALRKIWAWLGLSPDSYRSAGIVGLLAPIINYFYSSLSLSHLYNWFWQIKNINICFFFQIDYFCFWKLMIFNILERESLKRKIEIEIPKISKRKKI